MVEIGLLDHCLREDLNKRAMRRVMGVLDPAEGGDRPTTPEGQVEEMDAVNNPEDDGRRASRKVPFSRETLYIEREDFMRGPAEASSSGWRRVAEVRLRYAYLDQMHGR
jgi:glutaminyl-tRNA synthetase